MLSRQKGASTFRSNMAVKWQNANKMHIKCRNILLLLSLTLIPSLDYISRWLVSGGLFDVCNLLLFLQLNKILQDLGKDATFRFEYFDVVPGMWWYEMTRWVAVV